MVVDQLFHKQCAEENCKPMENKTFNVFIMADRSEAKQSKANQI